MSPPASVPTPPVVRKARPKWMEDDAPSPEKAFFAWTQEERGRRFPGAIPEAPPSAWASWYAEALAAVGGDEQRLRAAWLAWLEDAWGQSRQPVCAARAFVGAEVWRRHVPGQGAPAEGMGPVQAPLSPVEARRRAALEVGRGDDVRGLCATGCGSDARWGMRGHPLCAKCWAAAEAEVVELTDATVAAWVASHGQQAQGGA
ncbi:hypothetical protein COSO111634_33995 [Corallococcus soli]